MIVHMYMHVNVYHGFFLQVAVFDETFLNLIKKTFSELSVTGITGDNGIS